jgi:hypothetical protein
MTRKRYITLIVGIAALVLGAELAMAMPPEVTAQQDPDRAAFVRAARFFKESQRITPVAGPDFWNYESGVKVADTSPGVLPQDLAKVWAGSDGILGDSPKLDDLLMAKNGVVDRSLVATDRPTPSMSRQTSPNTNPEVGIGLGIGIVLVLGLALILRVAHVRPFAH